LQYKTATLSIFFEEMNDEIITYSFRCHTQIVFTDAYFVIYERLFCFAMSLDDFTLYFVKHHITKQYILRAFWFQFLSLNIFQILPTF